MVYMAATTLCIIDMQPYFRSSQEDFVIDGVIREVSLAKRRKAGIVVVEYSGCGKTDRRIKKAIGRYHKVVWIKKGGDDGSRLILKAIGKKWSYSKKRIRLCGVNTGWCVFDTAVGLANRLPESTIQMAEAACNDAVEADMQPSDVLEQSDAPDNVKVIY